ncbi:hypothetical protein GQ600_2447 [Phytophthora cactorum]|nr:hypothetical protein GQ600_2447 [Phytophthora cactorum]
MLGAQKTPIAIRGTSGKVIIVYSSMDSDLEAFSHNYRCYNYLKPTVSSRTGLDYCLDNELISRWVNNPTIGEFYFAMIGRADIEESKSNVAMDAWLPQASYPCGNFSDTSSLKFKRTKGSIGHAFTVCIHTENQNQVSFYPFVLHEISVLIELTLGHLCYHLTDVPPQPNSPPDDVFHVAHPDKSPSLQLELSDREATQMLHHGISKTTLRVVVFHGRQSLPLILHLPSHFTTSD